MIPLLVERLRETEGIARKRSVAREFLQARILLSLQDHGAFSNWAFLGGTALRFLYALPRYSEDLDFSLAPSGGDPRFESRMRQLRADLEAEAYDVDLKVRTGGAVHSAFVRFRGLLHAVGLSALPGETLAVKVEIDTRPPFGAGTAVRAVRRHFLLNLLQYDKPSLLAGKLHALLNRKHTKGRDLYDLAWYLADPDWPEPNAEFLAAALRQTGHPAPRRTARNWRASLRLRLAAVDWKAARSDVAPFLEREADLRWVAPDHILPLLES